MTYRFVQMVAKLPRFKELLRVDVESAPVDEASMQDAIRVYARVDGVEVQLPPSEWGFTYADVIAKEAEIKDAAMQKLRKERDELLADGDKITMMCFSRGIAVPDDWKTYQQALRDLPANSDPDFSAIGELTGVDWPVKPTTKP
jgi:hypothetical protein